ncbi:MAG: cadmium-translocating P-type ATPase [Gammaproteobacteria bacterium]|nr:cadmium-translocating P-type ATPase [Gammaproteobacteria bacterium]
MAEETDCYHCGLPVPPGSDYRVSIEGESREMCCPGCQAVAQAIVDSGLTDYYKYRTDQARTAKGLIPEALQQLELYDKPELQRSFVAVEDDNLREAALILEGITCAACVWLNERHVNSLPGVVDFRVNYSTHRARLKWDDSQIHLSEVLKAITAIGYIAHPFDPGRQEEIHKRERKQAMRRMAVAGLGMMQVMMISVGLYAGDYYGIDEGLKNLLRWVALLLTVPVVLYSARPFFNSAWRDLRRRQLGMDVPVSLAIGAAFLASTWATVMQTGEVYFDSVTMFTLFLLTSRFLEMGARQKAGQAAEELVRLLPAMATRLLEGGSEEVVTVAELQPGDRVLIRPGESVPADGLVTDGRSSVDESLLTGESLPRSKEVGSELIGGTVNVESPLTMQVEKVGADTVISAISRLLDRAQVEKPKMARLADRAAAWFVGAILILATAVGSYWSLHAPAEAFWIVLSVLVVTCPCALSLATPAALTAATSALTRMGLLTTRGHALETLARLDRILFDKTGTLTRGQLQLSQTRTLGALDETACLSLAAGLERGSEHPVGRILREHADLPANAEAVEARPGFGIEGRIEGTIYRVGHFDYVSELAGPAEAPDVEGGTAVYLGSEAGWLAQFVLTDELRDEAHETVAGLQALGIEVELLSGDHPDEVARIARQAGIQHWQGGQRPDDKLAHIRSLQQQGLVVAMVGDGVNDAPVLAGAQVSIAMGGGTQLAHASADMVLFSEQLSHLVGGVTMARRTLSIIRQNLAWALGYNLLALPLASMGLVAPWMAAIGMSASSLVVVVNALRLSAPATRPREARQMLAQ